MRPRDEQVGAGRWHRWLAGLAALAVLLGAGAAAWYRLAGGAAWADGAALAIHRLPWRLGALIGAAVLLIPLLFLLRPAGRRHLSLLQRCLALSILLHVGLTMLLSLVYIYQPILHYVAEAAGLTTAVNLEVGPEALMRVQIRHQITDLPVTELPVRDPTLMAMAPAEVGRVPAITAGPPEWNIPHVEVRPTPVTVQPEAPRQIKPIPAPEAISLPAVPVWSQEPALPVATEPPIDRAEQTPQAATPQPPSVPRPAARAEPAPAAPGELTPPAVPVRRQGESLAEIAAAQRPEMPAVEQVAADPAVPAPLEPETALPRSPARPAATAEPEIAAVVGGLPAITPAARTSSPRAEAASVSPLAVPAKVQAGDSLAVAVAAARPPIPAAASPVAIDIPAAADAPEVQLPALSAAATRQAEPDLASTAVRPPGELAPRPLAVRSPEPLPAALAAGSPPAPALRQAGNLAAVSPPPASRPPRALPAPEGLAPAAIVTPMAPIPLAGAAASPDPFFQRSVEQRPTMLEAMGGSKETEAAVARALAYLARCQAADGRWPFDPSQRDSGRRGRNDVAITGLAVLCFLTADHTPAKSGPYQELTAKAIEYLLAQQRDDGDLRAGGDMYSHAIAALAVVEAAAMTGQPRYQVAAIKAGRFIINSQNRTTGGWRYDPGDPGDTSVLGWQILALHSLERMGVRIPSETRSLAFRWLDRVSKAPHRVLAGYQDASHTPRMTAEALTSRILLGQQLTDSQVREACDYLQFQKAELKADYYYWYYGSLALAQLRNDSWNKWNQQMQRTLIGLQQPDGSWNEKLSRYGPRGGRIYATALAALTLQVYYRYLPSAKTTPGPAGR